MERLYSKKIQIKNGCPIKTAIFNKKRDINKQLTFEY